MKIFIIVVLIFFNSMIFSQNPDSIRYHFSIDLIINHSDYSKDIKGNYLIYESGLLEKWRKEFYRKYDESNNDEDTRIDIPDSLANALFEVRRGYYCSIFKDSQLMYNDLITGFYSKTIEGTGTNVFYSIEELTHFKTFTGEPYFTIISDDADNHKLIETKIKLKETSSITSSKLSNIVVGYLLDHRHDLFQQSYVFNPIDTALTADVLKPIIKERFSMSFQSIVNSPIKFINGTDNLELTSFTGILINDELEFLTHSKIQQIFKINSEYYILFVWKKPSTGIVVYNLYKVVDHKLKLIFSDSSYST